MRRGAALAFGLLLPIASPSSVKPIVTIAPLDDVSIAAGAAAELRISVRVAEGFHLQANPASQEYLVRTKLELADDSDVKPGEPIYPPGRPYRLQGASSDLSIYEGRFEIRMPLRASPAAAPGDRTLRGTLHYQACDARRCLAPSSLALELHVTIGPP